MEDERLKKLIGTNIAAYRKRACLTQAGLAEKLNYSDKAISKWERGESVPDVLTLVQLAELYEISVDDLLKDPDALPEDTGAVQRVMGRAVEKTLKRKADKRIILNLSSLLVWFVALLIFVVCSSLDVPNSWISFFFAIPADSIVRMTLLSAWKDYRRNQLLISVLVWGVLLSFYMTGYVFLGLNIWRVFLLGIPGQAAIFLWFRMFRNTGKENQHG